MNARLYDPVLGRMISPDNFVNGAFASQAYNRYSYAQNNPLKYTDPDGNFVFTALSLLIPGAQVFLPWAIGADIGMLQGGALANGTINPFKWDFSSSKTWGYMAGGAIVGGISGGIGHAIAGSSIPFANTLSLAGASLSSSVGTYAYTGGQTDISIGFGFGSYNFTTGEFGYLGKSGNSLLENIGYGLGAMANVQDALAGFNSVSGRVEVQTENLPNGSEKDKIGHFQVVDKAHGESLIDFGPKDSGTGRFIGFSPAQNSWTQYANNTCQTRSVTGNLHQKGISLTRVNFSRLSKLSESLTSNSGSYNFILRSCSSVASRNLFLSGYYAFGGIHPYIFRASIYLRELGFRPSLLSHYLTNP